MANSSLPPDFSYVLELAKPPTLEEELDMETSIRQLLATDDINELKLAIDAIYRQNYQQSVFISHSLDKTYLGEAATLVQMPNGDNLVY